MCKSAKIIGIDVLWFDQLITLDKIPADNESEFIQGTSSQGGGKVCSALAAAARQGIKCKIVGINGTSARSRFLIKDFKRHGIDTTALRTVENYTEGFSIVLSDKVSGGRRILWGYDNNQPSLCEKDIDSVKADIENAEYLHLCRMDKTDCYAAKIAKKSGTKVCLDADFYTEEIAANLNLIDILIGSEEFYNAYFHNGASFEENMKAISMLGPKLVVFTFGKNGCKGYNENDYFEVPAFSKNITVVDTVGAGDVFHGGYLAALCLGLNPKQAARYASAVSAIKCTAIGGRAGIPTKEMVEQYLSCGTFSQDEINQRVALYSQGI